MTLICWLQYPSENECVYLQGKSFFHKIYSPFFWRTIWLLLLIWIIINTNWFYDNIIYEFFPCFGITCLKLMSFWIFAQCNKNSLCKSLFFVWSHSFMTNTRPSLIKSHIKITRPPGRHWISNNFYLIRVFLRMSNENFSYI